MEAGVNFRKRIKPDLPGFQLAPMIDIVFNLLFFSLTTQVFSQWETELNVKLPTAEQSAPPQRLPGEIIINVLEDGTTVVNRQRLSSEELGALLGRIVAIFPGQPVLIRGDRQTAYRHVIHVLDQCRKADIWNISFATIPAEEKTPSP
jgi:biopolymer transport protein ExbD